MRRVIWFIFIIGLSIQVYAQQSSGNYSNGTVGFEVHKLQNKSSKNVHRAPARVSIDIIAQYDEQAGVLDICSNTDEGGEVFLYQDGKIIDYDSVINTSFQITSPGVYKIEVIGTTWIAEGYIQL